MEGGGGWGGVGWRLGEDKGSNAPLQGIYVYKIPYYWQIVSVKSLTYVFTVALIIYFISINHTSK